MTFPFHLYTLNEESFVTFQCTLSLKRCQKKFKKKIDLNLKFHIGSPTSTWYSSIFSLLPCKIQKYMSAFSTVTFLFLFFVFVFYYLNSTCTGQPVLFSSIDRKLRLEVNISVCNLYETKFKLQTKIKEWPNVDSEYSKKLFGNCQLAMSGSCAYMIVSSVQNMV